MQTKFQLATLKKDSDAITTYFRKVTCLATTLGAVGQPLYSSEFTIYLLACLGLDYESLFTSLTTCPDTISTPQIYSYLLNHESRLFHQTSSLLFSISLATYNTTTST